MSLLFPIYTLVPGNRIFVIYICLSGKNFWVVFLEIQGVNILFWKKFFGKFLWVFLKDVNIFGYLLEISYLCSVFY